MHVRRFGVIVLIAMLLGAAALTNAADAPKIHWHDVKGEGQVYAWQGGRLALTLKGGDQWYATFGGHSKISVIGIAQADFLRPGVAVKFNGEFDKKTGVASAPITELTIVTLRPGEKAGLISDEAPILPGEKRVASVISSSKTTVSGTVVGAIASLKENAIQIGKYKGELAPDLKINVDMADPSIASHGDSVDVKGKWSEIEIDNKKLSNNAGETTGPGGKKVQKAGTMVVEEITITLLNPLAPPKKKLPPGTAGSKTSPDAAKAADSKKAPAKD